MKRTKKYLCVCLSLLLAFSMLTFSVAAEIDVTRESSLTVLYAGDGTPFEGLTAVIFRIAEIKADGSYALAGDFEKYPVDITNVTSQEEWRAIANTLASYSIADSLAPTAEGLTDAKGEVRFGGLQTGMYLVLANRAEREDTVYLFENFLISVPSPDEDGNPQYDMYAIPKHEQYTPTPGEREYKVVKQWKDGEGKNRPVSVEIELYKDGVWQSGQVLSGENNWSYSWKAEDDGSHWTVVERNVPTGYSVTVAKNETTFLVTNTYTEPSPPPDTGDTSVLWPYILVIFFAGAVLTVPAVRGKRVDI